jgi:hypothetical protein
MYAFSLFTTPRPSGKRFWLNNSQLQSQKAVPVSHGHVKTTRAVSMAEFAAIRSTLTSRNVLAYGICNYTEARIVTKEVCKANPSLGIPRALTHFQYVKSPSILCLDYDPQDDAPIQTHEEVFETLCKTCRAFRDAPVVFDLSGSTCIKNRNTGEVLRSQKGKRIYVGIADGTDIPRFGNALFQALFQSGHGWIVTTQSRMRLKRSIIDRAMFSPIQPDYCAAACKSPLYQDRPTPRVFNNDAQPMDTRNEFQGLLEKPRHSAMKVTDTKPAPAPTQEPGQPGQFLEPDTRIELKSGIRVSWREILRNSAKYHKQLCLDPFENSKDGMIFSKGTPGIRSFLSGGTFYKSRYQNFAEMPKLAGVIRKAVARS